MTEVLASTARSLVPDYEVDDLSFDYSLIASQISKSRRDRGKRAADSVTLNTAITSVRLDDTIVGSSTLVVSVADPAFTLVDFFDVDENGRVDAIDVNYPLDSPNWWRMTQLGIINDAGLFRLTLTFMERPAVYLLHHKGPYKASRGSVTRAQFFKRLVDKVQADNLIFRSKELTKRQPISQNPSEQGEVAPTLMMPIQEPIIAEPEPPKPVTPKERKEKKKAGIPYGTGAKIKGVEANNAQIDQVNRALDVAYSKAEVDQRMVEALVCAGIGESSFRPIRNQGKPPSPYHGVFQGHITKWDINDTEGQAQAFLFGGKGFQPEKSLTTGQVGRGGCYYWHKENPSWGPGLLAVSVEGSRDNFPSDEAAEHFYGRYAGEARELIKLYGGGFEGGGTTYRQQYNFEIGTDAEPFETYWDGMNRLADEVKWRLFIDGRTVYYDSDTTLIRQQPALVLELGNQRILRWDANWDGRAVATEMSIDLLCSPFEFRAGEVFLLQGFGPLSRGSTVGLPGRWLVSKLSRSSGSPYSTVTLVQPTKPLREPATELNEIAEDDSSIAGKGLEGIHDDMTPREIIDTLVLPIGRAHDCKTPYGLKLTSENNEAANRKHKPLTSSGNPSDHRGEPGACAADMSNGGAPTPQMDALAEELRQKFKMGRWADKDAASPNAGNLLSQTHTAGGKSYKFQLIWRAPEHMNHVHFGVKQLSPVTREQLNQPEARPGTGTPATASAGAIIANPSRYTTAQVSAARTLRSKGNSGWRDVPVDPEGGVG